MEISASPQQELHHANSVRCHFGNRRRAYPALKAHEAPRPQLPFGEQQRDERDQHAGFDVIAKRQLHPRLCRALSVCNACSARPVLPNAPFTTNNEANKMRSVAIKIPNWLRDEGHRQHLLNWDQSRVVVRVGGSYGGTCPIPTHN